MAKRKANSEDLFEPKLSKTEESEVTEQNAVVDGKSRRVRKKSAKLLEMEEYEVFEKKILKTSSKAACGTNSAKLSAKKSKVKSASAILTASLENLADVATAELNTDELKPHIPGDIKDESLESPSSVIKSPVAVKPEQTNSTEKVPKIKPIKLKNISSVAAVNPTAVFPKPEITPKLKQPKPKQSFEDQLIGPDTIAVQNRTKVKKVKKPKLAKDKPNSGATVLVHGQLKDSSGERENAKLKSAVCTDEIKPEQQDSDFKSDEDQPAIWPSEIKEERNDPILIKLKKKKTKKNKLDVERPGIQKECVGDTVDNGEVKYSTVGESVGSQEGQLEIDLDRKQEGKPGKKKRLKKHDESSNAFEQTLTEQEIKDEYEEEGYGSGQQPTNVYSNTEIMAMKLKTSSEKKASGSSTKMKEKRFRRRGPTAYTMFSNNYRTKVLAENPGIDFAQISKRLGEIWQCLPAKEKMMWKRKARQRVNKIKKLNNGSTTDSINDMVFTSKVPSVFRRHGPSATSKPKAAAKMPTKQPVKASRVKSPEVNASLSAASSSSSLLGQLLTSHTQEKAATDPDHVVTQKADDSVPCNPIDVAAHLKLLGDSLQTIGFRLQDHKGPIAVQGSLSVLLDSSLCAMASIMCLTNQLPEVQTVLNKTHSRNLDNIAYIMPGIG